jgi:hypothetical protein
VAPDDVRWLTARLYADGEADAVETALWVESGASRELYALALSPGQRDTILRVMLDPPERLAELRGVIARDHRERKEL